jgi:hypothetical protein
MKKILMVAITLLALNVTSCKPSPGHHYEFDSGLFGICFLIVLYFLPIFVGGIRKVTDRNGNGIAILNILLGWTILGWVGALIWAVMAKTEND